MFLWLVDRLAPLPSLRVLSLLLLWSPLLLSLPQKYGTQRSVFEETTDDPYYPYPATPQALSMRTFQRTTFPLYVSDSQEADLAQPPLPF